MNAATRGVILAIAAVIIGVIVLGQGFSDDTPNLTATAPATSGDDGGAASGDGGGDDSAAASDDAAGDDSAAASDDGSGDDSAAASDDGSGDDSGAASDDSAATDGTGDDSATDTPSILHPPAEVRVLVANGTTVAGLAGRTADELQTNRGYNSLTPTNVTAGTTVDASSIYYGPGYELDARQIAQILNAPPESVAPIPADPPVGDLAQAHVLVIIGPDLVPG